MDIYSQNIYEIIKDGNKKHVLIIYNISGNHYIGLTVYNTESINFTYINSINKFVDINDLQEYTRKDIKRISVYKGKIFKDKQ